MCPKNTTVATVLRKDTILYRHHYVQIIPYLNDKVIVIKDLLSTIHSSNIIVWQLDGEDANQSLSSHIL